MVNIVRQCVKGYILLESLIAMGIFVTIASIVLEQLHRGSVLLERGRHQQEILSVATMAVQTNQDYLVLNGVEIEIVRDNQRVTVIGDGEEVLSLVE